MLKKLNDVCTIVMGQSPKSQYYNYDEIGIPFMQGCTTFGYKFPKINTWTASICKCAEKGDLLFTVRAPVGKINFANRTIAIGRGLAALKPKDVNTLYLFYLILANEHKFIESSSGTIYTSINKEDLQNIKLNVHSDETQQHIVNII